MKCYGIFINDKLYAWTDNRKYAKIFLAQRNNKFYQKKVDYDSVIKLIRLSLEDYPLYDGDKTINVVMTLNEENKLMDACDECEAAISRIHAMLTDSTVFKLKDKVQKSCDYLCNTTSYER